MAFSDGTKRIDRHLRRRKVRDAFFFGLFFGSIVLGIAALAVLLIDIAADGIPWLTFDFITTYPSRHAGESGIKAALYGSLWVVGLTGIISVPLGVANAARRRVNRRTRRGGPDMPGLDLHPLKGHWAVDVTGNWRLTFRFEGEDAYDIDLTDYH